MFKVIIVLFVLLSSQVFSLSFSSKAAYLDYVKRKQIEASKHKVVRSQRRGLASIENKKDKEHKECESRSKGHRKSL